MPVLGVVENMSAFIDPDTGRRLELLLVGWWCPAFRRNRSTVTGHRAAAARRLAELADAGMPILVAEPESAAAVSLRAIAEDLVHKAARPGVPLPILRG